MRLAIVGGWFIGDGRSMGCGTILMLHMREMHASAQNSGTIWMVLKRRTLITWTRISGCLQTLIALLYGWRCTSPVAYVISLQIKSFLYVAWNTDTVIYCQNARDLMSQVFGDQCSFKQARVPAKWSNRQQLGGGLQGLANPIRSSV
jgi:hypothetical protein